MSKEKPIKPNEYFIFDANKRVYRSYLKPAVWLDNDREKGGFGHSGSPLKLFSVRRFVFTGENKISYIFKEDYNFNPFVESKEVLSYTELKIKKKDFHDPNLRHRFNTRQYMEEELLKEYIYIFREYLTASWKKGLLTNLTPDVEKALKYVSNFSYFIQDPEMEKVDTLFAYLKKEYGFYPGCEYNLKR